jgi:hypothetical protein
MRSLYSRTRALLSYSFGASLNPHFSENCGRFLSTSSLLTFPRACDFLGASENTPRDGAL